LIILLAFMSCNEKTLPPQNERVGFDFFPLETGLFRTYQVEQVDFSLVSSDTTNYQLQEVLVDSFLNVENDYTYILHRLRRPNDSVEWELDSVWTTRRTGSFAVTTENNISIVKLVFPIKRDVEWDGNILSSRTSEIFRYEDVFEPLAIGDTTFESTVKVIQSDLEDNLIMRDEREEIYARGIGLIRKDFVVLNFCAREDCLGQGIIESGQVQKFDLIGYGKD